MSGNSSQQLMQALFLVGRTSFAEFYSTLNAIKADIRQFLQHPSIDTYYYDQLIRACLSYRYCADEQQRIVQAWQEFMHALPLQLQQKRYYATPQEFKQDAEFSTETALALCKAYKASKGHPAAYWRAQRLHPLLPRPEETLARKELAYSDQLPVVFAFTDPLDEQRMRHVLSWDVLATDGPSGIHGQASHWENEEQAMARYCRVSTAIMAMARKLDIVVICLQSASQAFVAHLEKQISGDFSFALQYAGAGLVTLVRRGFQDARLNWQANIVKHQTHANFSLGSPLGHMQEVEIRCGERTLCLRNFKLNATVKRQTLEYLLPTLEEQDTELDGSIFVGDFGWNIAPHDMQRCVNLVTGASYLVGQDDNAAIHPRFSVAAWARVQSEQLQQLTGHVLNYQDGTRYYHVEVAQPPAVMHEHSIIPLMIPSAKAQPLLLGINAATCCEKLADQAPALEILETISAMNERGLTINGISETLARILKRELPNNANFTWQGNTALRVKPGGRELCLKMLVCYARVLTAVAHEIFRLQLAQINLFEFSPAIKITLMKELQKSLLESQEGTLPTLFARWRNKEMYVNNKAYTHEQLLQKRRTRFPKRLVDTFVDLRKCAETRSLDFIAQTQQLLDECNLHSAEVAQPAPQ